MSAVSSSSIVSFTQLGMNIVLAFHISMACVKTLAASLSSVIGILQRLQYTTKINSMNVRKRIMISQIEYFLLLKMICFIMTNYSSQLLIKLCAKCSYGYF